MCWKLFEGIDYPFTGYMLLHVDVHVQFAFESLLDPFSNLRGSTSRGPCETSIDQNPNYRDSQEVAADFWKSSAT